MVQQEAGSSPVVIATILRPVGTTGVHTHANETLSYLRSIGCPAELVTPYSEPSWLVVPTFGVRRLLNKLHGPSSVRWYRYWHRRLLERALRRRLHPADRAVVYAHSPEAAWAALDARREHHAVVMAVHFGESLSPGWIRSGHIAAGGRTDLAIRRQERDVLSRVDGIVYVSEYVRRRLEDAVPAARSVPSTVIPSFVEIPAPAACGEQRDLITVGSVDENKNQRFLIDVVAQARRSGREVTLTIVGDGPERSRLIEHARARSVGDLVDFTGEVDDPAALLSHHRIYTHAAKIENLGIALLEAMGQGRPIVAPAVGGIPEILTEGVQGFLWETNDAAAGARLVLGLLDDDELRERMGAAARSTFEQRFAASVVAPRLHDFLLAAAARRSRATP